MAGGDKAGWFFSFLRSEIVVGLSGTEIVFSLSTVYTLLRKTSSSFYCKYLGFSDLSVGYAFTSES